MPVLVALLSAPWAADGMTSQAQELNAPTPLAPAASAEPLLFIAIDREVSSHSAKIDDLFPIRLDAAVMDGDRIVLPAGLVGEGQAFTSVARAGWARRES